MLDTLSTLPFPFWVVVALLLGGTGWAFTRLHDGSGIPVLAVLGTVGFWYVGDALYNDYAHWHTSLFAKTILASAWWQVAWFLVVFLISIRVLHPWLNWRYRGKKSGVLRLFRHGVENSVFQAQLTWLFWGCLGTWGVLTLIAAARLMERLPFFFFPFLGIAAEPWGRNRIGSGFDALLSLGFYLQLLVTAIFGVVAALSTNRRVRSLAAMLCLLTWPYFIFGRTRNYMLAAVIPGLVSWTLLRFRVGPLRKALMLGACFLVVNAWMAFVIANRSQMSIVAAVKQKGFSLTSDPSTRHEGLNMFEELCWVNTFFKQGTLQPSWGGRYFAEAINIIPRSLWPGKPLIGIDYSMARAGGGGDAQSAGVHTTISTGLIGQGVINFGGLLGPAAAALLMSLWVVLLARCDLRILELGRMPLFACGLILTFNLGRDITLITLYPFFFGAGIIWIMERVRSRSRIAVSSLPTVLLRSRRRARIRRHAVARGRS